MAFASVFDKLFPSDDPNDQRTHVWVGIIALLLLAYLVVVKRSFGARAI